MTGVQTCALPIYKTSYELLTDIKDSVNNPEILNLMAQNLMKLKNFEAAAGIFKKLKESYPNNHILLCDLAKCEIKIEKYKEAKENIKQALMLYPDFEYGIKLLKEVENND